MNRETRFPVQHPEFRYAESWNPYSKKLLAEMEGRVFVDNGTEGFSGKWREKFPDGVSSPKRPLCVEIGCNGGHVILEWAARDPAGAYIGIDWKFKQIFRGAEKAKKRGLGNLLFLRAHAVRLPYMFGEQEIDRLAIYFPDPWAKKSQLKNRLIQKETLEQFARLVKNGGELHLKTDHRGYFDWMLECLEATGTIWEVTEKTFDLHQGHPDPKALQIPEVTLFERLFVKDGLPIHSIRLKKRAT